MPKLLTLAASLILSSVIVNAQECRVDNPLVKTVRRIAEDILAADNGQDIDKVLALYTDDAILLPPNERPVRGRAAIKPRYEALFANFKPQIEGLIDEVCVEQKTAFIRGHNGGSLVPIKGGEFKNLDDSYLMLLRRDKNGAWRISHLIWHRSS